MYMIKPWYKKSSVALPIYGVSWDGSSNPQLTRTDAAALFTNPTPAVNNGNGSSPFDTILPWSGMQRINLDIGVFVAIPKFYYKLDNNNTTGALTLQISMQKYTGFETSPAHADRGDGVGERDVVYVAAYQCASDNLGSKSGILPAVNVGKDTARNYIHHYEPDAHLWDMQMLKTIQMLYLVEYAHFDSQRKIGYGGVVTVDTLENTGLTDSMLYHTGTCAASTDTWGAVRYRYIEGLWNNAMNVLDGCYASGGEVYIISNPANYANDSGGTATGIICATDGDAKWFKQSQVSGLEWCFIPDSYVSNAQYDTYICDRTRVISSHVSLATGSELDQNMNSGLFSLRGIGSASGSNSKIAIRLQVLPS